MIASRSQNRKGIALVFVLMLVVLVTIMVVAFFASVKTETSATRATVGVQNSRQLADLATQVVMAQIQQATQTSSTRLPGTVAWASQPGMLRCYDNTGKDIEWYKLYSAQNMTVPNPTISGTSTPQSDLPEAPGTATTSGNWATSGSLNFGVFTDLNSPVIASDGTTLEYPIMNPAAATSVATSASGTLSNLVYGFDIQSAPGYNSTSASSATNNQAAMPVRWLYVLQDGTMVPGTASGTAGTILVPGATSSNPIVGRVAFWTDDETCKLNINTAADGSYFDTPRFSSASATANLSSITPASTQDADIVVERNLAQTPPVTNEYQRYIGHPAQTRLSYALGSTVVNSGIVNRSHLFSLLSPFMQWGGSKAGTYDVTTSQANTMATPARQTPYATLDEWMFSTSLSGTVRAATTDLNGNPLLTNTRLQQLRFFLSANSEAPEVNLFGQPRISMWPIYATDLQTNAFATSSYSTTFDQLVANSATLTGTAASARSPGGTATVPYTYYFGRQNAANPTADWGTKTLNLISSSNLYTRNQDIFLFLRTLAKNNIPGYGHSFDAKYSSGEMDQVITEIFDYCRSLDCSDLLAGSTYSSTGAGTGGTWGIGQVTPICIPQANFSNLYSTQGFGRFNTISDVAIDFTQFDASLTNTVTSSGTTNYITGVIYLSLFSPAVGYPSLDPHLRVVVQTPGQSGTIAMSITTDDTKNYPVFGLPNNGAAGNSGKTVFSSIPPQGVGDSNNWGWNNGMDGALLWGGAVGARQFVLNKNSSYGPAGGGETTPQSGNYFLCGLNMAVSGTCRTFSMAATPLEIKIYHTNVGPTSSTAGDGFDGASTDLVQDITVQFPGFTNLPLPTNQTATYDPALSAANQHKPGVGKNVGSSLSSRLWWSGYGPQNNANYYIDNGDVVQSLVAGYNGDTRLIAAQHMINDTANTGALKSGPSPGFVKHPFYGMSNQPSTGLAMAHAFWDIFPNTSKRFQMPGYSNPGTAVSGSTVLTGTYGQLVPSASYPSYVVGTNGFVDYTLSGTTGAPSYTGDWDNGWGHFSDGPYINKADEVGTQYYSSTSGAYFASGGSLYYDGGINFNGTGFASPNRSVASPVMFGSLPTGVPLGIYTTTGTTVTTGSTTMSVTSTSYKPYPTVQGPQGQAIPWQTLLFRPQANHYGGSNGGNTIEDEEILDWFWMPVVEPYSISTPMATSGKVNLNYQIAPFTYITRATALMGVLGSEYVIATPTAAGSTYKTDGGSSYSTYRTPVKVLENDGVTLGDSTGTLRQFKEKFATGEIFKSAAEICDIYLVPQGYSFTSNSDAEAFWQANQLTGDNSRERPYNGLYSRLTTKSNTYTVHVKAQALKQPANSPTGKWIENSQQIISEYRGSVTINRYLDPQDTNIPDFMAWGTSFGGNSSGFNYSLDNYYKYRVMETRQFLP